MKTYIDIRRLNRVFTDLNEAIIAKDYLIFLRNSSNGGIDRESLVNDFVKNRLDKNGYEEGSDGYKRMKERLTEKSNYVLDLLIENNMLLEVTRARDLAKIFVKKI